MRGLSQDVMNCSSVQLWGCLTQAPFRHYMYTSMIDQPIRVQVSFIIVLFGQSGEYKRVSNLNLPFPIQCKQQQLIAKIWTCLSFEVLFEVQDANIGTNLYD